MDTDKRDTMTPTKPSAEDQSAEEYAESDFLERRGFQPDENTWKDAQYGRELRSSKYSFLGGIRWQKSRHDEARGVDMREYELVKRVLACAEKKCAKENYTLEAGIAAAFFEVIAPIVDARVALAPAPGRSEGGENG